MREECDMATSTEIDTAAEAQRDTRQLADSADSRDERDIDDEDAWEHDVARDQDQLSGTLQADTEATRVSSRICTCINADLRNVSHRLLSPTCRPQSLH